MSAKWLLAKRRKVDLRLRPNATSTGWQAPVKLSCALAFLKRVYSGVQEVLCHFEHRVIRGRMGLGVSKCDVLGPRTSE